MLAGVRKFFESTGGRNVAIALCVLGLVIVGFVVFTSLGSDAVDASRDRVLIDAKTGEVFGYTLQIGDKFPVKGPSGEITGYPAETCFWTKDGKAKDEPTYVLLKQYKGESGPTFCPDCGRLVIGQNPAPGSGVAPPPTEQEYKNRLGTN